MPLDSSSRHKQIPALVLGRGLTVLGVIRSLGRRKIPSYCIGATEPFVQHSRWYRSLGDDDIPDAEARGGEALSQLKFEKAVLIPCTDIWVRTTAAFSPELRERFPSSVAPASTIDSLVDKRLFYNLLVVNRIPHPLTIEINTDSDLRNVDLTKLSRGFLKPTDSQQFGQHFKKKAFAFETPDEALKHLHNAREANLCVILQEYVPGPPTEHYFLDGFVDRHGAFKAWFARQRLRMFPPDFGNSTYLMSIPLRHLQDGVESLTTLLTAVKYRGIFSAEFKRDPRDGLLKLLEINARPWWYVGFAVDCGVDVVHMAYCDALGLPVAESHTFPSGVKYVFTGYDGMACRRLRAEGKLTSWQWVIQWITAKQALFTWYDPWPSMHSWGVIIGRAIKGRLGLRTTTSIS